MKKFDILELEKVLNVIEKENFDDCSIASIHGSYKEVWFHKGIEACISMLKEYYNFKKNVDIFDIMRYL